MCHSCSPPASLKGVRLYFFAEGTLPEVQADPGRPSIRHADGGAMLADDLRTYVT